MRLPGLRAPFPLLRKELAEQAARRRTYIIRMLYAVLLGGLFALFYYGMVEDAGGDLLRILGSGREVFEMLVALQFAGIYVFLPGMTASVLAGEKERDSLSLLLVTDLRPWEIVLEKYAGRLVPMFTFLLLGLPFLAIAYSFGGITSDYLLSGAYLLALTSLQVGAFGVMLSAFSRTTAQAFIGTYVLGVLFYFATAILYVLAELSPFGGPSWGEEEVFAVIPIYVFANYGRSSFGRVLVASIPIVASTVVFLVLARVFLLRRAFVRGRGVVLTAFQRLDVFWHRVNRLTGGIVLVRDRDTLPGKAPILWREVNRRSLGKTSHLVRIACILGIPIAVVASGTLVFGFARGSDAAFLTALLFPLWAIAALTIAISSATSVASERVNQTLDVLLASPMTGPEIMLQKAHGRRRLACVLGFLIMIVVLLEAWAEERSILSPYVLVSLLTVVVYLPMVTWVSLWIGLEARTPSRAVIVTVVVMALWWVCPFIFMALLDELTRYIVTDTPWCVGFLLSPGTMIGLAEAGSDWEDMVDLPPVLTAAVNFLWHGAIWAFFCALCLVRADHYLGRVPEPRRAARVDSAIQEA